MPTLTNPKYEAFALAVISTNGSPKQTMESVGYKYNASYYSQLKNMPKIAARIEELHQSIVSEKILTGKQMQEMLSDIATNTTHLASVRIKALHELYVQCGYAIEKVDIDVNSTNIIKYVELALPDKPDNEENSPNKDLTTPEDEFDEDFLNDTDATEDNPE